MGGDSSGSKDAPPKKLRFAPKIPPRKVPKPVEIKSEVRNDEDLLNQELLKHVMESSGKSRLKGERKSAPVQVVFGHEAAISSEFPRGPSSSDGYSDRRGITHKVDSISTDDGIGSLPKKEKEHFKPCDYDSCPPITLPLRRPNSGKPEVLDEQEASADFDETRKNRASELGLTGNGKEQILLFQLPPSLPSVKHGASMKGKEKVDVYTPPPKRHDVPKTTRCLEDLPAGVMGKMVVYKSGAIKLKLGDILFDVSAGEKCIFAQEVAVINAEGKHCCIIGELSKHAVVSPDVDSLLG